MAESSNVHGNRGPQRAVSIPKTSTPIRSGACEPMDTGSAINQYFWFETIVLSANANRPHAPATISVTTNSIKGAYYF